MNWRPNKGRHGRAVCLRVLEQGLRVLMGQSAGAGMPCECVRDDVEQLKGNHVQIHPQQDQDTENDYSEEEATHHCLALP